MKARKITSVLLAVCMALAFAPAAAFADSATVFSVDGIKYVVAGDGQVKVTQDIYDQTTYPATVAIPTTVTDGSNSYTVVGIDDYAFWNASTLTSLTLPDTITSIGYAAFGRSGIQNLVIPASVAEMLPASFAHYNNTASVTIADGNTSYQIVDGVLCSKTEALYVMQEQETVTLPSGIATICEYAFSGDTTLTSITFPDTLTTIGYSSFNGCTGLEAVVLPQSVTTFESKNGESYAFDGCEALENVSITGVVAIPDAAFGNCSSLEAVTLSDNLQTIGKNAFGGCSALKSIELPDSLTSIGESAFLSCGSLESITIPSNVKEISGGTFVGCVALTSITLSEGLTAIGPAAFLLINTDTGKNENPQLKSINIPSTVTSLGENFLAGVMPEGKTALIFQGNVPPTFATNALVGISGNDVNSPIVYYPAGAESAYAAANSALVTAGLVSVSGGTDAKEQGYGLTMADMNMQAGQSREIAATVPTDATVACTRSSDSVAVEYKDGKITVTGVNCGTATVTVSIQVNGVTIASGSCNVTVDHKYGTEWKSDKTSHWHECACGAKSDEAAHTYSDWTVTKNATETEQGEKTHTCTQCGYKETAFIPLLGHTHSYGTEWKRDATGHWRECACGDKADAQPHTLTWVTDREATATVQGSRHQECTVCGYQGYPVAIPSTGTAALPKTGDSSHTALWFALMTASVCGIGAALFCGRKRKAGR